MAGMERRSAVVINAIDRDLERQRQRQRQFFGLVYDCSAENVTLVMKRVFSGELRDDRATGMPLFLHEAD